MEPAIEPENMNKNLFRDQSIDAQKSKWMGGLTLISPISFSVLAALVIVFIVQFKLWSVGNKMLAHLASSR